MQVDVYRFENTAPPFLQPKKKKRNPTVAFPGSVIDPCQVGLCVMNKVEHLILQGDRFESSRAS